AAIRKFMEDVKSGRGGADNSSGGPRGGQHAATSPDPSAPQSHGRAESHPQQDSHPPAHAPSRSVDVRPSNPPPSQGSGESGPKRPTDRD
ncbi:MAG TPA: hypothetical protein VN613_01740, partial [Gemmatimonadaceae bacterium]|nr:hypothetical protein [Gemmatimonadaceae bacterium]